MLKSANQLNNCWIKWGLLWCPMRRKGEEGKGRNAIAGFLHQWAGSGLKPPVSSSKSKWQILFALAFQLLLKTEVRALPASGCLFGLPTKFGECHNCRGGKAPVGWIGEEQIGTGWFGGGPNPLNLCCRIKSICPARCPGEEGEGERGFGRQKALPPKIALVRVPSSAGGSCSVARAILDPKKWLFPCFFRLF
jgi:hypothetical protein